MAHAFLPPSGASGWSRCALWATMNQRYPQDDSPSAVEGTAAHWVGWELLSGRHVSEGQMTPDGMIVTAEMIEGGELLADTICELIPDPDRRTVETTLPIPIIGDDCFGTPDCWGVTWQAIPGSAGELSVLHIIDYKFGHRFVDEYWNLQGLLYLFGALNFLMKPDARPDAYDNLQVQFTIVQPRCYYKGETVRSHRFTVSEAWHHIRHLQAAAQLARDPNPMPTTNPACADCPGRHACPALQKAAFSAAEFSSANNPHDLTPQAAARELYMLQRALQQLEARVDGLQELTLANLKAGAAITHYQVEYTKPRAQWTVPVEQVVQVGNMFGKSLEKNGVVTPAAARKLGIDSDVISAYSSIPSGTAKLVPVNQRDLQRVFQKDK